MLCCGCLPAIAVILSQESRSTGLSVCLIEIIVSSLAEHELTWNILVMGLPLAFLRKLFE
jgi:hypothetical protein